MKPRPHPAGLFVLDELSPAQRPPMICSVVTEEDLKVMLGLAHLQPGMITLHADAKGLYFGFEGKDFRLYLDDGDIKPVTYEMRETALAFAVRRRITDW
jgi:hypothetical protein